MDGCLDGWMDGLNNLRGLMPLYSPVTITVRHKDDKKSSLSSSLSA